MLFPLNNEEKGVLKRLNNDKAAISALKKLFLNQIRGQLNSDKVEFLAAERIALGMIEDVFHQLSVIQPDNQTGKVEKNLV